MAQYTSLSAHDIEAIATHFAIQDIISFKVLSGGWENTNYFIQTANGEYVLTISEQKTRDEARKLAQILEHLEKNHFETSKIIRSTNNEPSILWKGRPVMIKRFIKGRIVEYLSPHLLELTGRALGKLHKIEAPSYLPKQVNYGKEQFARVEQYAPNSPFDRWLKEKLAYISPYLDQNLPKALIHTDVFTDNVIVRDDERSVVILDFEEAAYYYRIFDIGMMIIGTCGEEDAVNLAKAACILKGYGGEIQLLDVELDALQAFTVYAGAAMTFWRHLTFNYARPDPKLANHYLGLKVLTDDVYKLSPNRFLK
ncbi:MAG: homoserine kinase, partial [Saprospiraceae bacterium]|nr:homoserine kinase [Saprospiraceae bacterium]